MAFTLYRWPFRVFGGAGCSTVSSSVTAEGFAASVMRMNSAEGASSHAQRTLAGGVSGPRTALNLSGAFEQRPAVLPPSNGVAITGVLVTVSQAGEDVLLQPCKFVTVTLYPF